MKLDRSLQLKILELLRNGYPDMLKTTQIEGYKDNKDFMANMHYLEEHSLIRSADDSGFDLNGKAPNILQSKITAKGLDFLKKDREIAIPKRINWPNHILSFLLNLLAGGIVLFIGFLIISKVLIGGFESKTQDVFEKTEITSGEIISEPFEIGNSGGHFSIAFSIDSKKSTEHIVIKYELSYDSKSWFENVGKNENIVLDEEIAKSEWYIKSISPHLSRYIRFIVSKGKRGDVGSEVLFNMKLFSQ